MPKHLDICNSIVIMYVFELPVDQVCTMRSLTGGRFIRPVGFSIGSYFIFLTLVLLIL